MKVYDLHTHSTTSDGVLKPSALLARASAKGVDTLALTDHDSVDGITEARTAAAVEGIQLISGVEISVSWYEHLFHIVGLDIDESNRTLLEGLEALRQRRDERAAHMARQLAEVGIPTPLAGAKSHQTTKILSRTHFARYLVEIGVVDSFDGAFTLFLNPGTPGHVPMQWATLAEAVGWIKGAGGEAVIAHPARYRISDIHWNRFVQEFVACGGIGIEVVCSNLDKCKIERFAQLARDFGLLASKGSDFHSPNSSRELGVLPPLPADLTPIWHKHAW
ncbi:MAG: PHP domain-containing protein [Gammaproteobacteria bacterium]|nr:PHP domain-containing protein [Gammaproteobacteria bacterium]